MTKHFNEVAKLFDSIGRKHSLSNVFNDFLTMGICSFHRTNIKSQLTVKDPDNEKIYMEVVNKYSKDEIKVFPKILGELIISTGEEPYSDLLGDYFTMHITGGENGQFFTPDPVCDFMALAHRQPASIENKTVHDPACGSSRTLLRFAKHNPNNTFYGADNAIACAKMSTLNFFLNGLRGEIAWMNSLSMEWYGGWHINTQGLGIKPIDKEQSRIWSHPPKREMSTAPLPSELAGNNSTDQGLQLDLF